MVPVTLTLLPTVPMVGEKLVIVGVVDAATVNGELLSPDPDGVVTPIGPVVAPDGTCTTSCVAEADITVAAAPLNVTVFCASVLLKPEPAIVTMVPAGPCDG